MAIITDSTQPGAGQLRADSTSADAEPAVRVPHRHAGSSVRDSSAITVSGERPAGRLRPVTSASLHESIIADRQPTAPTEPRRKMSAVEFNTTMAHFYRGEIQRSNTWRTRLDTTTYWAVLTAGATLSFTFSSPLSPHFVIPINSILVTVFLVMEARRYRYYEIWASRVRVIETGYLAPMLALGWNLKVYLHPVPADTFQLFLQRATVGLVPGWIVFIVGFVFNMAVFSFAVFTIRLREAT